MHALHKKKKLKKNIFPNECAPSKRKCVSSDDRGGGFEATLLYFLITVRICGRIVL